MLSWKVVTILLLFSSLGSLVPVPGKHFLIETEDEAVDEPEMEGSICIRLLEFDENLKSLFFNQLMKRR